jgi:hypothetical protein
MQRCFTASRICDVSVTTPRPRPEESFKGYVKAESIPLCHDLFTDPFPPLAAVPEASGLILVRPHEEQG